MGILPLRKNLLNKQETYQRNINALPVPEHKIDRLWLGTDIPINLIEDSETIRLIKEEVGIDSKSTIIGNVEDLFRQRANGTARSLCFNPPKTP